MAEPGRPARGMRGRSVDVLLDDFGTRLARRPRPALPAPPERLFPRAWSRRGARAEGRGWAPTLPPLAQWDLTSEGAAAPAPSRGRVEPAGGGHGRGWLRSWRRSARGVGAGSEGSYRAHRPPGPQSCEVADSGAARSRWWTRGRRPDVLLAQMRRPIAAIALDLGYDDPREFRRAYKRWTGRTPTEARHQLADLDRGER